MRSHATKWLKKAAALLIAASTALASASAHGSELEELGLFEDNMILEGDAQGLTLTALDSNLFKIARMLPGEHAESRVLVKNTGPTAYVLSVYVENMLPENSGAFLQLADKDDHRLLIQVYLDSALLSSFPAYGDAWHTIGRIASGSQAVITCKMQLQGRETGNEYQEKQALIRWTFRGESEQPPTEEPPYESEEPGGPSGDPPIWPPYFPGGGGSNRTPTPTPSAIPTPAGAPTPEPGETPTPTPAAGGPPDDGSTPEDGAPSWPELVTYDTSPTPSPIDRGATGPATGVDAPKGVPATGEYPLWYYMSLGALFAAAGLVLLFAPGKSKRGKEAALTLKDSAKNESI